MQIILILAAFVTGFALAFAYFTNRAGNKTKEAEFKLNEADKQISGLTERLSAATSGLEKSEAALKEERQEVLRLSTDLTRVATINATLNEKLTENQQLMQSLNERFTKEFENLSNRLLEENSKKFTEQNKTNIEQILSPLRDRIKDFEKKVDDSYKIEAAERNTLKGEIKNLIELNKQISDEANNLAKALKGDTKKQGNWGEVILERILERSGLTKGVEYEVQVSTTNDDGRRLQPDVVVYLPEGKHLIIDSKVSLIAYEALVNCEKDEDRDRCLRDHILSVKNHIKQLSDKEYQHLPGMNSPDFVLLFMPIESSFGIAVQADAELFSYAWDRKIVMVSPSTLLATLRTISSIWKQEKQTQNALQIAKVAGGLYDKFVGFYKDMTDASAKMDAAKKSQDEAIKKLGEGGGNIIRKIEELKNLGAKTTKELTSAVLEKADD